MDRGVWLAIVHSVTELDMTERQNWTELNWSLELVNHMAKITAHECQGLDPDCPLPIPIPLQLPPPSPGSIPDHKLISWSGMWAPQAPLVAKNLPANAGDFKGGDSIPGSGRSPGVGNGNPLQYSRLKNTTDRGAWWATVHGATKSQTWLKQLSRHASGMDIPGRGFQRHLKQSHIYWGCELVIGE